MKSAVTIENIDIGYGRHIILNNINAEIAAGQFVGIIGCNGSGKSTLLKALRGLQPLNKGRISYFGRDIRALTAKQTARMAAYMQQNINLQFNYTGRDIVSAGRYPYLEWWQKESRADEELVQACLEYTGTKDLQNIPVNEISGGQRQRIFLAKVLAQKTPLIFMDEPTAGLDMVYQEETFRFTRELAQNGKTVFMVVHELNLAARYCDRIMLLGEGRLLDYGAPQHIFTENMLSRAYNTEVQIVENPLTGSLEITAKENSLISRKGKALLKKIC